MRIAAILLVTILSAAMLSGCKSRLESFDGCEAWLNADKRPSASAAA